MQKEYPFTDEMVNPVTYNLIKQNLDAAKSQGFEALEAYYHAFFDSFSRKYTAMLKEGAEKCYPGYYLRKPELVKDGKGLYEIRFQQKAVTCDNAALAITSAVFDMIVADHHECVRLYEAFDDPKTRAAFEGLRADIEKVGGGLAYARPYIHVFLPTALGELKQYQLRGFPMDRARLRAELELELQFLEQYDEDDISDEIPGDTA